MRVVEEHGEGKARETNKHKVFGVTYSYIIFF